MIFLIHQLVTNGHQSLIKKWNKELQQSTYDLKPIFESFEKQMNLQLTHAQKLAVMAMTRGYAIEFATGEGKTFVLAIAAVFFALQNRTIHIITANSYLATRDLSWLTPFFEECRITSSRFSIESTSQIQYGTLIEICKSYMENQLITNPIFQKQVMLDVILIDEMDVICIEEANTPLVLTTVNEKINKNDLLVAKQIADRLKLTLHYTMDHDFQIITFTEDGLKLIEKLLAFKKESSVVQAEWLHRIKQSLHASCDYIRDIHYVIQDQNVIPIDVNSGRMRVGYFSNGIHAAIQVKEHVPIDAERMIIHEYSVMSFLRQYQLVLGASGTIAMHESEIKSQYGVSIIRIPSQHKVKRMDHSDLFFQNQDQKKKQLLSEVNVRIKTKQPLLIACATIPQSEELSKFLTKHGISHQLLNINSMEEEATIIANAGQLGQITISTRMAGRGVDIKPSEESLAVGGLCIIGYERSGIARIDQQLIGRSGRQGNAGESMFFVSLEDEWMSDINGTRRALLDKLLRNQENQTSTRWISLVLKQHSEWKEEQYASKRFSLFQFDQPVQRIRHWWFQQRNIVCAYENTQSYTMLALHEYATHCLNEFTNEDIHESWDILSLEKALRISVRDLHDTTNDRKTFFELVCNQFIKTQRELIRFYPDVSELLTLINDHWSGLLGWKTDLQLNSLWYSKAQMNPLREFEKELIGAFETVSHEVLLDWAKKIMEDYKNENE